MVGRTSYRKALLALSVACALVLSPALRADVVVVQPDGGGDSRDLFTALNGAHDGDTIVLRAGDYSGTDCWGKINGKSLVVTSDGTGDVFVSSILVANLPAGKRVVLRGLTFDVLNVVTVAGRVQVQDCAGAVLIEDCRLEGVGTPSGGPYGSLPALVVAGSNAVGVVRSTLTGGHGVNLEPACNDAIWVPHTGAPAVLVDAGRVALHDCVLRGGDGSDHGSKIYPASYAGAAGLQLEGGIAFVSGGSITGGDGGDYTCVLFAPSPAPGGAGVLADAASSVQILQVDLAGGAGGTVTQSGATGLPSGPIEAPPGVALALPGAARSLAIDGPLADAGSGTLVFGGQPGDDVLLLLSAGVGHVPMPGKFGVLLLAAPLSLVPFGTITDPSGQLVVPFTLPSLGLGPEASLLLLLQGVFVEAGTVRLGGATSLVVIAPGI